MDAARHLPLESPFQQLQFARRIVRAEGEALIALADRLGEEVSRAAELILNTTGSLVVTGMGKAGHIGQKLTATFASTGTRCQFLHPAEAVHGDLGRVSSQDTVLVLSFSGETEEVVRILPALRLTGASLIAITGRPESTLARHAAVVIDLGPLREACPLGLAPSTSTTAMLAVGDALALLLSQVRGFQADDFARFHPAGSLGRKLAKVDEVMRPLAECRLADVSQTVREILVRLGRPGRRTGAIMVTAAGRLVGVFTDSDLARLLERKQDPALDRPIGEVMTPQPASIRSGCLLSEAMEVLVTRRISELPVVCEHGSPLGLLDITDVVGLLPRGSSLEVRQTVQPAPAPRNLSVWFPETGEESGT